MCLLTMSCHCLDPLVPKHIMDGQGVAEPVPRSDRFGRQKAATDRWQRDSTTMRQIGASPCVYRSISVLKKLNAYHSSSSHLSLAS